MFFGEGNFRKPSCIKVTTENYESQVYYDLTK
jgi:hypothetical protein